MSVRIIIKHVTGSKVNQVEQFPAEGFPEVTIGRDPESTIAFDPQVDDAVSRNHAVIKASAAAPSGFRISDRGSSNGTIVNGQKIAGEVDLLPNDEVELGKGGPKFVFDLQPRPSNLLNRTRVITTGALAGSTRMLNTAEIEAKAQAAAAAAAAAGAGAGAGAADVTGGVKRTVGRETVIGMLSAQRQQTNRTWMYILAGVLAFVGAGGGSLFYYSRVKAERAAAASAAALARAQQVNSAKLASAEAAVSKKMGMSPGEIVRKYGNATVVIDVQWRLYDKATGKPLFQMVRKFGNERLPCYVMLPNGMVVRWLTTDDQNQSNLEIGEAGRGSGFVIDPRGFILTNKHVAAGWLVQYGKIQKLGMSAIFKIGSLNHPVLVNLLPGSKFGQELSDWLPGDPQKGGGVVFRADAPIPVDNQFHQFEGRNEVLAVRFPGSLLSVNAHLVRASTVADAAEIKIDTQQDLATVALAHHDDVRVGDRVTVLGYPAFSAQTIAVIQSAEAGQVQKREQEVPEPTVTAGLISQMTAGVQQQGGVVTVGEMGSAYQLTVPSGAGNSGGPVFNAAGKVIGLFTYGTARETVTYAVPIKFGRDLLEVQRPSR